MGSEPSAAGRRTMPARKTAARKAAPRKPSVKKTAARKAAPRKASVKKTAARKASVKKTAASGRTQVLSQGREPARRGAKPTPVRRTSTGAIRARRGDLIVIDSPHVGSPPREGEGLRVIHGEVRDSYRVKWADGHETLISPAAGTVTIARA